MRAAAWTRGGFLDMENIRIARELMRIARELIGSGKGREASCDQQFTIGFELDCRLDDGLLNLTGIRTDSDEIFCDSNGNTGWANQFKSNVLKALQQKCAGTVKIAQGDPEGTLEVTVTLYGEYIPAEEPSFGHGMDTPGCDADFRPRRAEGECTGIYFDDDEDDQKYAQAEQLMDACHLEDALAEAVLESDATYWADKIDFSWRED